MAQLPQHAKSMPMMSWGRFAAMVATSTAIMVPLMYQLVYRWDHVFFSLNRLVASLVMGCAMTIIMLGFMWPMYKGMATKIAVVAIAAVAGIALLMVNRSQALVGDVAFMQAMIPHHSIAINNARKAHISDPRVRELADKIISSQVREIEEMKILVRDIETNGSRGGRRLAPVEAQVTPEMQPQIRNAVE